MSKSTLSLIATSLLLAATSVWLARELAAERAKHADIVNTKPTSTRPPPDGSAAPLAGSSPAPAAAAPEAEPDSKTADMAMNRMPEIGESTPGWAAAQRLRNSSSRASVKREYADFVEQEGLSAKDSNQLFELLAQDGYSTALMAMSGEYSGAVSPEWKSATEAELANELGEERMSRLRAYLEATPGRRSVAQLEEQLYGRDLPLSVAQRQRLVRAVVRESEHFRNPVATQGDDPASWNVRLTYEILVLERLQAISQPILSPDQMQALSDLRDAMSMAAATTN
jgi:hypothetical protein